MAEKVNSVNKVSPLLLLMILVAFILSLIALYIAFDSLATQTEALDAYSFLAIGFGGLALSAYLLLQSRSKPKVLSIELPRVLTTIECTKCDFKNIRDFQRDDYIFKKTGSCQKCNEAMTITAIYREEKKKN
ncbi:hypothetical protein E2P63_04480 [Candidatus Bathyarchaeota archaeon]|nr:hypothetical protein E2P63_04480 [Candidatus Bathyarchaeota archaeon]